MEVSRWLWIVRVATWGVGMLSVAWKDGHYPILLRGVALRRWRRLAGGVAVAERPNHLGGVDTSMAASMMASYVGCRGWRPWSSARQLDIAPVENHDNWPKAEHSEGTEARQPRDYRANDWQGLVT